MSLIDSHVGLLLQVYTKQDSVINRVDLQTGQSTSCFPALLQIKQPAIPVLRCHHSTLTRKKRDHKTRKKTHGHTGDLSIRQNYPRMHLHLHLHMHLHRHTLYIVHSFALVPVPNPFFGACRFELSKSPN